jgi:serine protease
VKPCGTVADPDFPRQWNLRAIGAPDAWDATQGSSAIVIGVVDTGVVDHPDLQGQLLPGYDFISNPDFALDGDGRDPDPTDWGDAALASGLSSWHGTHVAAIVVGRADTGGMVGVAPGCRVLPLRALGKGGGLSSDVADAILFAAAQLTTEDGRRLTEPVRVLNLSLGSPALSVEVESACAVAFNQGVLVVAAAGNDGASVTYPAAFPTVMAVGAVDGLLDGTSYSNHGPQISVCAPGGTSLRDRQGDGWPDSILSAVIDQTQYPSAKATGCLQGTSQAAPHVCGAAALLLSLDNTLTPVQLRTRLQDSALDRGTPGFDTLHGFGLVQAGTAVKRLLAEQGLPLGPPALHLPTPTVRFTGLETLRSVPLTNRGGGTLLVLGSQATTDDGAPWLSATLIPNFPGADCNMARAEVVVDRLVLPVTPGWWSGTIRLYGPTAPLGLIRVTVATVLWPRAGSPFRVIALDTTQMGVRADGFAHPQNDYRYWFRGLGPDTYLVKAGDDLDFDGFFCEPNDLCGWHGGDSEATATPLVLIPGAAFTGTDVIVK